MDSKKKKEDNASPKASANLVSELVFWWIYGLFRKGTQKDLEVDDLYDVLPEDNSQDLGDRLETHWLQQVSSSKVQDAQRPSLLRAIVKTFFWPYMLVGVVTLIHAVVLRVAQPVLLGLLISYFNPGSTTSLTQAYWYATGVIITGLIMVGTYHHTTLAAQTIGMRIRIATCSLVYRKILRLSKTSLSQTAAGQVVNLLSNDVNRFDVVLIWLHYIWIMPIQAVVITYFIYQLVGVAAFIGVGILFMQTVPVQSYLSKLTWKLRLKIAVRTDDRVRMMSEIIAGVQVIKMYAWEKPFELIVSKARRREIEALTKAAYLKGVYLAFMVFTERTSLFVTLVAYVLLGNHITPEKVFAMAQFYNVLQCTMAIFYPFAIQLAAETSVSIKRLEAFLAQEEISTLALGSNETMAATTGVTLTNATASWDPNSITSTLTNINLHVAPGTLCAVIGQVGSGKSSLLHAILGELPLSTGRLSPSPRISFSSQEPWLFAGSVRANILLGQPYEAQRYREVCAVCALNADLEQFPHGDKTVVGERGVALSGGQRARINLARAVYRKADVYLLDDPLSAVDTHVGKHLFDDCVTGFLRKKTVVLVTHQLQHLHSADLIVILHNGSIENQGTYAELLAGKTNFAQVLSSEDEVEDEIKSPRKDRRSSVNSNQTMVSEEGGEGKEEPDENAEFISKGNVRTSLYSEYFTAGASGCALAALAAVFVLGQVAASGADYWVTFWTNQEEVRSYHSRQSAAALNATLENTTCLTNCDENIYLDTNTTQVHHFKKQYSDPVLFTTETCMYVYAGIIISCIVLTVVRSLWFMKVCMNASDELHNRMFSSILKGTMRFFDTNPSGRVLNRFSKDMGSVDELLPRAMIDSIQILLVMTGILLMVILVNYWFLVPMVLVGLLFLRIRTLYLASAQDLKRLEGTTRSPVFSHLSATLNGLTTIRASSAQLIVRREFDHHQDGHTSAFSLTIVGSSAFGFWLDLFSTVFVSAVTLYFLVLDDETLGGSVGLAISQSLILTGMLQYGIRQTAEVVSQMTSVERVLDYTNIDKESDLKEMPEKLSPDWPSQGRISFQHVYLRYCSTESPVLLDLNFNIQAGHKVGIVGRTGAGKSSLISALFRLAPLEGGITVDGLDTSLVPLHDLRSRISIIPQEPVLFSATMRYNLDPFQQFSDPVLWSALEEVELKEMVTSLDAEVNEGGSNLSAGQRQLVCLARAIVRHNKILVLDEATANVDPQTDALIQRTIRSKFSECTVVTIAHRLNTIMDSDMVMVMDQGTVAEYDRPDLLLQNKDGFFYKMLQETGRTMAEQLQLVAEQHAKKSLEAPEE